MHLFYRDDLGVDCISAAGQNLLILISAMAPAGESGALQEVQETLAFANVVPHIFVV